MVLFSSFLLLTARRRKGVKSHETLNLHWNWSFNSSPFSRGRWSWRSQERRGNLMLVMTGIKHQIQFLLLVSANKALSF